MRSDNYKRHKLVCTKRDQLEQQNFEKWGQLKTQMEQVLKDYDVIYHVFWKPEQLQVPLQRFMDKWRIINDFKCDCDGDGSENSQHCHMLATWIGPGKYTPKKLRDDFTEKKAYCVRRLNKHTPDGAKRIISTILYIQTAYGWHKKLAHQNPYTLASLRQNIEWHACYFGDLKWAQMEYIGHLLKKNKKYERLISRHFKAKLHISGDRILEVERLIDLNNEKICNIERKHGSYELLNEEQHMYEFQSWLNQL